MTSTLNNPATASDDINPFQEEVFIFPASFAQQRLWFLSQLAPGNPFYNVPAAIRLRGALNLAALEQTFREIVQRHESLRTTFTLVDKQLSQVIATNRDVSIAVINLQAVPCEQQELTAVQLATAAAHQPFDLTKDALLRITLFQLSEADYILLLVLHHIVADGWSIGVFIRELSVLYNAFCLGQPSPLPELPIQYADFAHWQREWLQGEVLEPQLAYWRSQLQDLPVLNLLGDRPVNHAQPATYRGANSSVSFSRQLTNALEALSQQAGVSLFMLLLAAFQTLLYRYTGETDMAVGTPIANRNRSELEGLIGFFVNSLVLRTDLSGNPTFRELLGRVREVTLAAYAHQDIPFEMLVQALHPQRDLSRNPLFQVAIALQNTPIGALELPDLRLEPFEIDPGTARLDLEFHLWQSSLGLQGQITYSTERFEPATIARLLNHFQTLLQGIVAYPDQSLTMLPLLSQAERQQLLIEWNQTHQPYPHDQSIHQLFEAQVQKTPAAIALADGNEQLSYQALNQRSNQLAHHLQQLGVGPDVLVGICLERSIEMIVVVLGVLKAGGAYVPLDPTYPQKRLEFILQDAQVSVLITQPQWQHCANSEIRVVCLERDQAAIAAQPRQNLTSQVTPANLAYVIYTSGSTGQPKGVLIEHRGLVNLAHAQHVFALQSSDRILQFASLSFDASIFEIVLAWQAGATLYLAKSEFRLGDALHTFLRDQAITTVTLPPSVLKLLPVANLPALHTIISAGEACSADIVACCRPSPHRRFYNAYGPTEATVWATIAEIHDCHSKPSMGRAIANIQLFVLDANHQPVPIGVPGELYIGGVGLARGYLNQPELTSERFIIPPWGSGEWRVESGEDQTSISYMQPSLPDTLYQTGDRVRYLPDGSLEFLGRLDDQVKIRGHRIELGELEAALSHHPAIQQAAVINRVDSGQQQLVAYVGLKSGQSVTVLALRQFLQERLPVYCLPAAFVIMESLPCTPSGKIDRIALHSISLMADDRPHLVVAPQTSSEKALAVLWRSLLNRDQVGRDDNFFELGGDSLLAVQLIHEISQQFQQDLPLSTLFVNPTIAQLAPLLAKHPDEVATSLPWSPLVPLQTAGSKQPFFCVHPIFGVVLPYLELARQLGCDRPFYGLQPIGLSNHHPPHTRVAAMAAYYIQALQQVQPEGPYYVGGWSFGGLVAFEMAQQLQQAGHEVGLLALFDTLAPIPSSYPSLYDGLTFLLTTVARSIVPFMLDYAALLMAPRLSQPKEKQMWLPLQRAAIAHLVPEGTNLKLLKELDLLAMLRVFYANSQAVQSYTPKIYSGRITLFRTAQSTSNAQPDATLGWSQLTAEAPIVHYVSGNHLSMLKNPGVQAVAKQLRADLEQV